MIEKDSSLLLKLKDLNFKASLYLLLYLIKFAFNDIPVSFVLL